MNKAFEKILERLEKGRHPEICGGFETMRIDRAKEIVQEVAEEYNNGWIPVSEKLPINDDSYIMVSFSNFSLPDIARYEEDEEGGAFYPGDEEKSYASFGLFVNAWQPLPEPYQSSHK